VSKRTTVATLRRYRAEWQAALKRRDYVKTRKILGAALSVVSSEASEGLDRETRALQELLALDRRIQAITDGEAPARLPPARLAFSVPPTCGFRDPWHAAIEAADHHRAARVLAEAIAALSRQLVKRTRSQQALITRLRRLQRKPLVFNPVPGRCAFCGGTTHPGVDTGRIFMCRECVRMAYEILAEESAVGREGGA
jgi:hypothetical protein